MPQLKRYDGVYMADWRMKVKVMLGAPIGERLTREFLATENAARQ